MYPGKREPYFVKLSPFQIQYVAMVAERRNCVKAPHGVKVGKIDPAQTSFGTNYHGALAEFGVAAYLGGRIDTSLTLSGDGGVDLIINGVKIAVKGNCTESNSVYLYFKNMQYFSEADIGVLCTFRNPSTVRIEGWVERERFMTEHILKDFKRGSGPQPAMLREKLDLVHTLQERVWPNGR